MKNLILTLVLSLFVSISFSQIISIKINSNTPIPFENLVVIDDTLLYCMRGDIINFESIDITYPGIYKNLDSSALIPLSGQNNTISNFNTNYIINSEDTLLNIKDTVYLKYTFQLEDYYVKIIIGEGTSVVGMNELVKEDIRLSVYPNPVRDIVNVEFTTTQRLPVELYTLSGQLILSETNTMIGDNKVQLNMYDLPSGMYLIKVGNETFRTVKQ